MKQLCVLLLFIFLSIIACRDKEYAKDSVQKGVFQAHLTETGELQVVSSRAIANPFSWEYRKLKINNMVPEGEFVKKGQLVVEIDTSKFYREIEEKKNELAIAQAEWNKVRMDQALQRKSMEGNHLLAKSRLYEAAIDTQRAKFESDIKSQILKCKWEKELLAYQENEQRLLLKEDVFEAEKIIQENKIIKIKADISKAKENVKKAHLVAPADGMVVYKEVWKGNGREKVQIGDEVYPMEEIVGLPDLSKIKVKTYVDETDIYKIELGQKAEVCLDAYPKKKFTGEIIYIGKFCHRKDRKSKNKVFKIEILLNESDIILRPGMTVKSDIFYADYPDTLFVGNEYLVSEGRNHFLYVKKGFKTKKVEINIGPQNRDHTVVSGDIKAGQKLLLPQEVEAGS